MDQHCGIYVGYGKDDIITDCKYCRKTDRIGFGFTYAYGYECTVKPEKRHRINRCRNCYFGAHPW